MLVLNQSHQSKKKKIRRQPMLGCTQHHFFSTFNNQLELRRREKSGAGFTLIELLIVAALFAVAFLLATTVFANVQSNQRGIAGRQQIVADGRYLLEAMARTIRLGSIDYHYYRDPDNDGNAGDAVDLAKPAQLGSSAPFTDILAVRDQQGNQTCYRWLGAGNNLQTISGSANCNGTWTDITPADIIVTKFQIIITPASDPFLGTRTSLDCKNVLGVTADGACPCSDTSGGTQPDDDTDTASCLPQQRCVAISGGPEICLNVNKQPTVTLVLETKNNTTRSGEQSSIALQTTVTPRTLRR